MSDEFDAVVERVRERVTPEKAEQAALERAVADILQRVEAAAADVPVETDVVLAGSTARGTWLPEERDVDIFVKFPPSLDSGALATYGLDIGHAALPESREEYAEHPYVVGAYEEFQVDVVPCYDLEDATAIQSAVDRTPFHTRYVVERLTDELAAEVRVCKQLFTAIGVYGSDLRTRGFSGFLTELLVLEYGGFRELVDAAADWKPSVRLDPEGHGTATFEDPLVVVDPTDPERNVAAVLSPANVARVQHFARDLLADSREALFERPRREPLSTAEVRERFADRGTTPVALRFVAPDVVDDELWPQLERSRASIAAELDRRGFDVVRSAAFADDDAVLLFELAVAERPRIERHEGPPVHVREHAEAFYRTYADRDVAGPFVDGDRYVVERPRDLCRAVDWLDSEALFDVGLGARVKTALEDEYALLAGEEEVATLAADFGVELARYLSPTPRGP